MHLSFIFNVKGGSPYLQHLTVIGSKSLFFLHVKTS